MKLNYENASELFQISYDTQGKVEGGGCIYNLTGPPGIGKTAVVKQWAKSINYAVGVVIGARSTGTDYGLWVPNKETGRLDCFTNGRILGHFGEDGRDGAVVFFDEINNYPEDVQSTLLSLFEDREWEGEPVGDNVIFVTAGNGDDDGCGGAALINSLRERLCDVPCEVDATSWNEWGQDNGVDPSVLAFHAWTEGRELHQYDADAEGVQPSPRGWVKFSHALKTNPTANALRVTGEGYIGANQTASFLQFIKLAVNAESASEIIARPFTAKIYEDLDSADRGSLLFATATNLVGWCQSKGTNLQPEEAGALITYLDRLPETFAVFAFRLAKKVNAQGLESCDEHARFVTEHRGL